MPSGDYTENGIELKKFSKCPHLGDFENIDIEQCNIFKNVLNSPASLISIANKRRKQKLEKIIIFFVKLMLKLIRYKGRSESPSALRLRTMLTTL
jgi:hypothetical protein